MAVRVLVIDTSHMRSKWLDIPSHSMSVSARYQRVNEYNMQLVTIPLIGLWCIETTCVSVRHRYC